MPGAEYDDVPIIEGGGGGQRGIAPGGWKKQFSELIVIDDGGLGEAISPVFDQSTGQRALLEQAWWRTFVRRTTGVVSGLGKGKTHSEKIKTAYTVAGLRLGGEQVKVAPGFGTIRIATHTGGIQISQTAAMLKITTSYEWDNQSGYSPIYGTGRAAKIRSIVIDQAEPILVEPHQTVQLRLGLPLGKA